MRRLPLALLVCLILAGAAQAQKPRLPAMPLERAGPPPFTLDLTARERLERPDMARLEDAVRTMAAWVGYEDDALAALRAQAERLVEERAARNVEIAALRRRLRGMLPELWTLSVGVRSGMDLPLTPWAEADRRLHWLAAVQTWAGAEAARIEEKNAALAALLDSQEQLRGRIEARHFALEKAKDSLLSGRLTLLAELEALRRDRPSPLERLNRVLAVVDGVRYRLRPFSGKPLDKSRGGLTWPVDGKPTRTVDPTGEPSAALVFATAPGATVRAVHEGRVAFAGPLAELGQVVVLSHGQGFASVSCHLRDTCVERGQWVEAGQPLGSAGNCPPAKGPGVSFELRFGEKAINLDGWFIAGQ